MFSYYLSVIRGDPESTDYNLDPLDLLARCARGEDWYHHDPLQYRALRDHLNARGILHHYEAVQAHIDDAHTLPVLDTLLVLHVYDPNVAFDIRMTFDMKPMRSDWREFFCAGKSRRSFWWNR